jgi:hypothetical protein
MFLSTASPSLASYGTGPELSLGKRSWVSSCVVSGLFGGQGCPCKPHSISLLIQHMQCTLLKKMIRHFSATIWQVVSMIPS